MKIKLVYPKIPDNKSFPLNKCIPFEKYDGTNIHFVFNLSGDRGVKFCIADSFGTRRDRFPLNDNGLVEFNKAHPGLSDLANWNFLDKFLRPLEKFLFEKYVGITNSVTVFAEFLGPNSFAGTHNPKDIKQLIIFDVMIGQRFLSPEEFIKQFEPFNIARVIYKGKYTGQFVEDVRNGKYLVNEGMICKGMLNGNLYMAKIKTNDYLDRLKKQFDNWEDYWE